MGDTLIFREPSDPTKHPKRPHQLPPDLLRQAARRLRTVSLLYAFAFLVAGYVSPILAGEGQALQETTRWLPGGLCILAALGVAALTLHPRLAPQRLMDIGLGFMVVGSFGIAMSQYWGIFSTVPFDRGTVQGFGLSWVAVWMVFFVVVVPSHPWKTALGILGSAAAVPAIVGLSMRFGGTVLEIPALGYFLVLVLPYLITGVMAYAGSRVVFRLGTDVTRAREMGSYQLVERLGRGGMGEVWRARHRMLARPAAIKLIRPEVLGSIDRETSRQARRRFEREAQATATMCSPHTIEVYDFGVTDDGTFYYVMELLEGFDTETLVRRFGGQPPERVLHLLRQVCHSLSEAHANRLIHRDIKPANVFTCRYGREVDFVKVLDFGLVKTPEGKSESTLQLTREQEVGGTPAFMAPEQVLGDRPIDGRTDLYAVGCLGYWLLTGELVFTGETPMKTMMHHVHTQPVPPSRRTETTVPPELDEVILACLEKDPDRRPSDADDLRRRLQDGGISAPWTPERAQRWWEAHQPRVATGGAKAILAKERQPDERRPGFRKTPRG